MLSKLGMTSTRTRPFKAPQWLLSEATRVNGGALRVGFTYTNPVTSAIKKPSSFASNSTSIGIFICRNN
jgi:predicted deacetylase